MEMWKNSTFNLPDLSDRFLEGNGFGYIEAGLPNITGQFGVVSTNSTHVVMDDYSGSFYGNGYAANYASMSGSATGTGARTKFDASRSSSIYGQSSTVQPATCKCYFMIKYNI